MNYKTAIIVILAPIMAMLLWLISLSLAVSNGQEVIFNIEGYDPRDILRGHYLQYRINYGLSQDINYIYKEDLCLCINNTTNKVAKGDSIKPCKDLDVSTCPLFIKGKNQYGRFVAGIERYYIPERYREALSFVPQNSTIKVRITSAGNAYVTDLLVDGRPVLEYAKSK